jgi:SecD/SecF fusion protein
LNRRPHLILIAIIAVALAVVAALAYPQSPIGKEPTLGLDLQGGLEVTLQAVPPRDRPLQEEDLQRSVEILRNRIDRLGVSEPEIRTQGDDQIVIDMPGITNPEQVIDVLGRTAQLELYDLEANLVRPSVDAQGFPVATPTLFELLAGQQSLVEEDAAESWYLFDDKKKLRAGPTAKKDALLQSTAVERSGTKGELPDGWRIFGVPPNTVVLTCGVGEVVCPGVQQVNPSRNYWYLIRYDRSAEAVAAGEAVPEMTGGDLKLDGTRQDFDTTRGEPIVTMQFTDRGGDRFAEITAREAQRGKTKSTLLGQKITQHFAIVLDREIKSWPSIDWEQYPNGIGGQNGAQITGIGSIEEARNLALVLQTGALPVTFQTLDQTAISATLGKDSLEEAWKAALAGLIVVALFLLVYYRFLGAVAVVGLTIYAAFLYAAILLFNVTLTLPGFAGMILTLGVAADANIVIFERIKEEYRSGKSVRAAIAAGYAKGFRTILDANVVIAGTALILFLVATAGVKGFALMLLIGTAISLLTAVAATRAILGLLGGFRWFDSPRLMGAQSEPPKFLRRDFMGRRNVWFAASAAIFLICLGALALKGMNLGIDFRGGTQVTFETRQPVSLEAVRAETRKIGQEGATVVGRGAATNDGARYSEFAIRTKTLEPAEQTRLTTELEREFGAEPSVRSVSGSFGRQIAEGAILAIFFSLLLIVIYISARFEWRYSVPVIVALLHDVLITVGVYALLEREVSTATVAAILTVLGYSIYDTIIIFDRIRENIPLMRRSSFRVIGNVSLWEMIPRSLATTFSTLLPVAVLYVFGGETLKDFAFALLVGIGAGAYSSIFIAAPLLGLLKEREPDWARKKDDVSLEGVTSVGMLLRAQGAAAAQPTPELVPAAAPGDLAAADEQAAAAAADGDGDGDAGDGDGDAVTPAAAVPPRAGSDAKREQRRQRRKSRPHGRAR